MCLAAIAHHYSFSYEPYARPDYTNQNCCQAFLAMWDVSDVQRDISEHIGIVSKYFSSYFLTNYTIIISSSTGSSISRRIRGRSMYSIPRGNDEYSNLVSPRAAMSMPDPGFYQNDCDELIVNYGTVNPKQQTKAQNPRVED